MRGRGRERGWRSGGRERGRRGRWRWRKERERAHRAYFRLILYCNSLDKFPSLKLVFCGK